MVAPMALVDPRFGIIVVAGCAVGAALWMRGEAEQEARVEHRIRSLPIWMDARQAGAGPLLRAWQKWLVVWGSWGWKGEPLLVRRPFQPARLVPSERSYMLVDEDIPVTNGDRLQVVGLGCLLPGVPLLIVVVGWVGQGWLPHSRAFQVVLILFALGYWWLLLLQDSIVLFTSTPCADAELAAYCAPAELRLSYLPQPAHRWILGGALDRPWRRAVFVNAIDYAKLSRSELVAVVAHEAVHLRHHHDRYLGQRPLWLLTFVGFVAAMLRLLGLATGPFNWANSLPPAVGLGVIVAIVVWFVFVRPHLAGAVAEVDAYRGAARISGVAPVLRLLQTGTGPRPRWMRRLIMELEAQAASDASARREVP